MRLTTRSARQGKLIDPYIKNPYRPPVEILRQFINCFSNRVAVVGEDWCGPGQYIVGVVVGGGE
ncbi:hypothetical protein, partial [Streptomyces sodiiphilus]|uniref:hypothetical protein n=1 Tax=Streptomyces sodiiphilus TaxID=226217 RepID=UPI0031D8A889